MTSARSTISTTNAFRALGFSAVLSATSMLLVFATPLIYPVRNVQTLHSPYAPELEQMLQEGQAGGTPEDFALWSKKFDELADRNNRWFEEQNQRWEASLPGPDEAWLSESRLVAPLVAALWAVLFFVNYRRTRNSYWILVLAVPCMLALVSLIPVLNLALIAVAVFLVRAGFAAGSFIAR